MVHLKQVPGSSKLARFRGEFGGRHSAVLAATIALPAVIQGRADGLVSIRPLAMGSARLKIWPPRAATSSIPSIRPDMTYLFTHGSPLDSGTS
jgi:hypothetical protein